MNYRDSFSGPEVLAVLRERGRLHFRTLCDLLEVHGLTAQGALIHVLALLKNQGLILSDETDFTGWDSDATIELAPSVEELARVLGISITELAERDPQNSVLLTPLFGRPRRSGISSSDIFMVMPFADNLLPIYEDHVQPVVTRLGLSIRRADDVFSTHEIMKDVWVGIYSARVVIAECTGRNPNVFYEIGIAHTLGKPVILTTQTAEDVPSDLRNIRYIHYRYTPPGMKLFETMLTKTLSETLKLS